MTKSIRHFCSVLMLVLVTAPLTPAAAAAEPREPGTRPNVLFIAIDDLNDWVGPLGGHPQAKTPAMDRLAARGTVFLNAHVQAPLCNPSRASLLTGLRPSSTGIYGLAPSFRNVEITARAVTLPQHFARHGYQTFACGKIHHDGTIRPRQRTNEFQMWGHSGPYTNLPPRKFVQTPDPNRIVDWGIFPSRDEDQPDWLIAESAIGYLRSLPPPDLEARGTNAVRRDIPAPLTAASSASSPPKPFFLACGFRLPHVPCYITRPWMDLFPEDTVVLPSAPPGDRDDTPLFSWYLHWKLPEPRLSWLQSHNQWRPLVRAYLASIAFMDAQIGRVLDALEASGHRTNTVVVLWSDNGWHLGEKAITGKNTLWEPSTRVPLIFAGPGIAAGGRCSRPAELLDIYPTLIDLCGLPARSGLEGHSLIPQLRDAAAPRPWPAITTHNQNNHAVRTERWRYIRYADGLEELYDIQADPEELHNLASDPAQAQVLAQHRSWLPKTNLPMAPGSAQRVLSYDPTNHQAVWEGKPIRPEELEK